MNELRILYIHQDGLITGSAISLLNMLNGFKKGMVDAQIIFFQDGPAVKKFEEFGYKVHVCKTYGFWTTPGPKWYHRGNINNLKALIPNLKLRKLIKIIKPDIIHVNDKAAINATISSLGLSIPIIQHLRSTYYICNSNLNKLISKFVIEGFSDYKISISEDEANGFRIKNTEVVFNSIIIDDVKNAIENKIDLDDKILKIGWLGRFSKSKGAWDFINLAGEVIKTYPSIQFHMLAPIPDSSSRERVNGNLIPTKELLESLIKDNNLDKNLILHGYRNDYLSVVAAMDVMVNCNRLGAFGRQSFETTGLGVATISTTKFPDRSSVLNSDVSIIVQEGNFENLLNALILLIENVELRKKIALNGKNWVENNFNARVQSEKIFSIYCKILNN